jgi:pimeloyl-ACP methyl ester carboxylesterase
MNKVFLFLVIIGFTFLIQGCTTSMINLDNYVIRLNRDGLITKSDISNRTIAQTIKPLPLNEVEAKENIERIFKQVEKLADEKNEIENGKTVAKLLLYVHGGLNFFNDTDKRVERLAKEIETDEHDWAYPVFFSWPSSFPGTYSDHLVSIREGRKAGPLWGILSSPFVLIADLVQSIGKYPLDVYYQLVSVKDNVANTTGPSAWLSHAWKQAEKEYCSIQNDPSGNCKPLKTVKTSYGLQLNWSNYYSENVKDDPSLTIKALTTPLRYTLGTLGQSSIAAESWKNMKRRTSNILYPPALFDNREQYKDDQGNLYNGLAGGEFFKLLLERIKTTEKYSYQITLVGHSMGTIVLNNALKKYKTEWSNSKALRNIVYMAAACSINDVIESVFPLMKKINTNELNPNQQVNFYNLMLNRVAEISETNIFGVAPTGSLLIYIDQHLETPNHPFDRTFGSEINVFSSLTALKDELEPKGIGDHMQFKSFDSAHNCIPKQHGDFSDATFWKKSFWDVLTINTPPKGLNVTGDFNAYCNN